MLTQHDSRSSAPASRAARHDGGRWYQALCLLCLALLPVAFCAPETAVTPGWSTIRGDGAVDVLETPAGPSYAVRHHTLVAGLLLSHATEASITACAESCTRHPNCTAFNYCPREGGCLADPVGATDPQFTCELRAAATTFYGLGVYELASGNPRLADTGLRITAPDPGPLEGYDEVPLRSLVYAYDLPVCNGTVSPNKCSLSMSLEEARVHCDALPECKVISFAPHGRGNITTPVAAFKGWPGNEPIDLHKASLSGLTYLYVKDGYLPSSPEGTSSGDEGGGSSLSAGAIAGIAVGCASAITLAMLAIALVWHRRKARAVAGPGSGKPLSALGSTVDPSGGASTFELEAGTALQNGSTLATDCELLRLPVTPRSKTRHLQQLLSVIASPQWKDVLMPMDSVQISQDASGRPVLLGNGASGQVFKGKIHRSTPAAIKVFELLDDSSDAAKHFIQEASILWKINHPHIVQFFGCALGGGQGFLLMELMAGGDLEHALRSDASSGSPRELNWHNQGRRILFEIASGLHGLHMSRIVHLDLKTSNILLTRDMKAKIGDCGFSRIMQQNCLSSLGSRIGTFNWCAPEVLLGQLATEKADIFSLGVLIWEICTGEPPQRGRLRPLEAPADCPQRIVDLQRRCVSADPALRPSAEEIVEVLRQHQQRQSLDCRPLLAGLTADSTPLAPVHTGSVLRSVVLPDRPVASPLPLASAWHGGGTLLPEPTFPQPADGSGDTGARGGSAPGSPAAAAPEAGPTLSGSGTSTPTTPSCSPEEQLSGRAPVTAASNSQVPLPSSVKHTMQWG